MLRLSAVLLPYHVNDSPAQMPTLTHLFLVHQILIEGLLSAQQAGEGILHQLEKLEHRYKLVVTPPISLEAVTVPYVSFAH